MTAATPAQANCKSEAGRLTPVIDRNRCEGKEDCVRVCPYGVFEIRVLQSHELSQLGWLARVKMLFHGNRQAFATRAADCHSCGLCVTSCPERAIKLAAVAS